MNITPRAPERPRSPPCGAPQGGERVPSRPLPPAVGYGVTRTNKAPTSEGKAALRFALKTRPEHQTWEELLALWGAGDEYPLFVCRGSGGHFHPRERTLPGPSH